MRFDINTDSVQINVQFTENNEPGNNNAAAGKPLPLKDVANKPGLVLGQQDEESYQSISEGESGSGEEPHPAELETGKARGQFVPENLRTELKSLDRRPVTIAEKKAAILKPPVDM